MKESLGEQLKKEFVTGKRTYRKIKQGEIKQGTVVYLSMDQSDGLTLTDGYKSRYKYVTIIGETEDGYIIGSLLINSNANFFNQYNEKCQYPLSYNDYPDFLEHKSWLDCSRLFCIPKEKILKGGYCGTLSKEDMDLILQCLIDTPTISKKQKRIFGIIDE